MHPPKFNDAFFMIISNKTNSQITKLFKHLNFITYGNVCYHNFILFYKGQSKGAAKTKVT